MNKTVLLIIFLLLLTIPAYFFVYCMIALKRSIKSYPKAAVKHHLAVLIPARNEEATIGNLLASLQEQKYPKADYQVFVLANHCTDSTEEIARKHGADILYSTNTHSKGDVLQQAFDQLVKDPFYDAYIVIDADNLTHPEFLDRMNDAYSSGCDFVQGRRTGKNVKSWISCCYEVFYIVQNIFFNHARACMKQSASFNGTAWLISRKYLLSHGYEMYTLTEDVELMAVAALQNEKIAYTHDALVYDEYPDSMKVSIRQLDRWIFGQVQCMRRYSGVLLKAVMEKHYKASLDMFYIVSMPMIILIGLIIFILWLVNAPAVASWFGRHILWILLILYGAMIWFLCAAIRKNQSSIHQLLRGVLCFPVFILIWLVLMPIDLCRRQMAWKPIEHNTSKRIEEMK